MKEAQRWILFIGAVGLANILGLISLHGPMQMSFSLTAIPILLISLTMGWEMGFLAGVFGGITQSFMYGSFWYLFYTGILGCVSGYFAKNPHFNKKWGSIFFAIGTFFMFVWIAFVNQTYFNTEAFAVLISLLMFLVLEYTLIKKHLAHNPLLNLTLAGCAGATAYIPYDIIVMRLVQNYAMTPLFVVLAKDIMQDYAAAIVAALILQSKQVRKYFS